MRRLCSRCGSREAAVYPPYFRMRLCRECYNAFFENRVRKTVEEYRMFRAGSRIGVAVSGGKDSAALLYSLKKVFPDKEYVAIHLDHGIGEYSRNSLEKARELAEMLDVELHVFDYRRELGITIPDVEKTRYRSRICSVCGTIRRWALAKAARELRVDVLATGHNLDDILEVMLNLFIVGDFRQLRRLKPVLPPEHPSQVWKVKPLFKSLERENLLYVILNNIPIKTVECPYHVDARSYRRKKILNQWEREERNIKYQLLSTFLNKLIPLLDREVEEAEYGTCRLCGGPSLADVCSACRRINELKRVIATS